MINTNCHQKINWEESYNRKENYCFVASDEIVRFVSRFILKRNGINSFKKIKKFDNKPKVLDVCCGIGRNLVFGDTMGFDMHGFDLSENAISIAKEYCLTNNADFLTEEKLKVSNITSIPWANNQFDFIFCESALDSMKNEIALQGITEIARVLKPKGLFYSSLISGEIETINGEQKNNKEEIVSKLHEFGTVQSYYNKKKLLHLFANNFIIKSIELHKIFNDKNKVVDARWHVVAEKI